MDPSAVQKRRTKILVALGWVWIHFLVLCHTGWAASVILGVQHWSSPSSTRFVVDLSEEVAFTSFLLSRPPQVVVDIHRVSDPQMSQATAVDATLVDRIRLAKHASEVVRLVLDLTERGLEHEAFLLPPIHDYPFRLVIDVKSPAMARKMKAERHAMQKEKEGTAYAVVLDPGHGGEDAGAIGLKGTEEKDVVLRIARILQARLDRYDGIRAFLTRTGDYFVGLRKRVEIAQDYGADLFLSIHADAALSRSLNGASVYCLSLKGATDEAARILAEKENAADFVGALPLVEDPDVNAILLDLMQARTIHDSLSWGKMAIEELRAVHQLRFSVARQAGFRVLRAPDFPSILVEVAYISNPREESLLRKPIFHERVAKALEASTVRFLCEQKPVQAKKVAASLCDKTMPRTHVVQPGQSLFQIASLYHTTVGEIQKLNHIKDASRIYPGQRIALP